MIMGQAAYMAPEQARWLNFFDDLKRRPPSGDK
jgi:hypothetical protein